MSGIVRVGIACAVVAVGIVWPAAAAGSPALEPLPSDLAFADHGIHDDFNTEIQQVRLTASASTTVTSVAVDGTDAGEFALAGDGCTNAVLEPDNWCQVGVRFDPSSVGPHAATLLVVDSSGETEVGLSGTGITGGLASNPDTVVFQPQPYFFGGQSQGINLYNPSSLAATQATAGAITGRDAARFYVAWGDNCFTQLYFPGNGCGMGIGFNPTGPGTFEAQLELSSDAAASPLVVPLSATALAGPRLIVTPSGIAFGAVPVGQDESRTVSLSNAGDFPLQVQQTLFITGRPDVFFVTNDDCALRVLAPGEGCSLVVHFKPTSAGDRDAALFLIVGNQPRPVESIGVTGTGIGAGAPAGTGTGAAVAPSATVAGAVLGGGAAAGDALSCRPVGVTGDAAVRYGWLRNGTPVTGQSGAVLELADVDVGSRIACELSVGTVTVRSAESAPIAPRNLSRLPGAFTDAHACRTVLSPRTVTLGQRRVAISNGAPSTAAAPLTLRASTAVTASIGGHVLGRGRTVTVSPRALAAYGDGEHMLRVSAGAAAAQASIVLAACRLAVEADGGPGRSARLAVSAAAAVGSVSIRLPRSLRIRAARGSAVGRVWVSTAGDPVRRFTLVGPRTTSNGVAVVLARRSVRITGLPPDSGVVRMQLDPGVLFGRGGSASAAATLRGDSAPTRARTRVIWAR